MLPTIKNGVYVLLQYLFPDSLEDEFYVLCVCGTCEVMREQPLRIKLFPELLQNECPT